MTRPPAPPVASRDAVAAWLCGLCGLAYAAAGIAFFADPSTAFTPGTLAYWTSLAAAPPGRQAFLLAFALAGLLAFCTMGDLARLVGERDGRIGVAASLGRLGFGATAVAYFRILGGEAQRAAAYASGGEAVRQAIASFSLSIDPGGYLIFCASGVSLLLFGLAAWRAATLPRSLAALGIAAGAVYLAAFAARLGGWMTVVDAAAGIGGILLGPLWWLGLARLFAARGSSGRVDPVAGEPMHGDGTLPIA